MINIDSVVLRRYKTGDITKEQFINYLIRAFSSIDIAESLAELIETDFTPIALTREQFERHFRIKGTRADGTPDGRGLSRHKKDRDI